MRLFELERTNRYNQDIINFLTDLGVESNESMGVILISRDSMMNAIGKPEDVSYSTILNMIREYMPKNLYIAWSAKDDDYYYLEVNE